VAKVGLDRKAIRDFVAGTCTDTIVGKIRFQGSENVGTPGTVSQWQKGEFEVVWPKSWPRRNWCRPSRPGEAQGQARRRSGGRVALGAQLP
jgi:hypothetical protein